MAITAVLLRPLPTPAESVRRPQSTPGGIGGYSKEVENMEENWPEAWIGETVEVTFEDRAIVDGKLLDVNDDGIVLEEQTRHEAGPVVEGDDVDQELGTVREHPVTLTHHTIYPWSSVLRVRMTVSRFTPRKPRGRS